MKTLETERDMNNMKSIMKIFAAMCLVMGVAASCTREEPVANEGNMRVQRQIDHYNAELTGAEYGWIAEINTVLGGIHTLWMGFDDNGKVNMYFDYVEYYRELETTKYESSYRIKPMQLPTLSFDTYSFLSIFSDPNQLNNGAGQAGTGLGADFEYEILDYKNDVFTLVGLKNSQNATMRKATQKEYEAVAAGSLMANVDNAPAYQPCYHTFSYKGVSYDLVSNGRSTGFMSLDGGSAVLQAKGSMVDFDGNIVMMEPLVLGDTEVSYIAKTGTGYSINMGGEIIPVNRSVEPVVSLYGNQPKDLYFQLLVSNNMQNRWSSEYFFTYRQALQNIFNWTLENLGYGGYYLIYTKLNFYLPGEIGVECGHYLYQNGELNTESFVAFEFRFDITKNTDGSLTFSNDWIMYPSGNPDDADIIRCMTPLIEYYAGNRFFVKSWPVIMAGNPMVALIPADNRELGVMVGAPVE